MSGTKLAPAEPTRYEALDALRGVAALLVMVFHLQWTKVTDLPLVPHGYLAVDMFFVLSGFVLSHAYSDALRGGALNITSFIIHRTIRLYPLFIVGLILSLGLQFAKVLIVPDRVDAPDRIVASFVLNFLFLPSPVGGPNAHGELFPGNNPLWSVSCEFFGNLVWAALVVHWSMRSQSVLLVLSSVALLFTSLYSQSVDIGPHEADFIGGYVRFAFSFTLGVLMHRKRFALRRFGIRRGDMISVLGLAVVLAFPESLAPRGGLIALCWDLLSVFVTIPLMVAIASMSASTSRIYRFLGDVSYPVYAIHAPILSLASGIAQMFRVNTFLLSASTLVMTVLLGGMLFKWYDKPIRQKLTGSFDLKKPHHSGIEAAS